MILELSHFCCAKNRVLPMRDHLNDSDMPAEPLLLRQEPGFTDAGSLERFGHTKIVSKRKRRDYWAVIDTQMPGT